MTQTLSTTHPRPLHSLIASARRISNAMIMDRRGFGRPQDWQEDAWDMYDLVGEQRFLATTLAGRLGQAKFYVGKLSDDPLEPPEPLDADKSIAAEAFSYFGDSPAARAQLIVRLGINLFVAGDGWLVGIPRSLLPDENVASEMDLEETKLDDLTWRMLSVSEVSSRGNRVVLLLGESDAEQIIADPNDLFMVRVWRPHPRRWWQADSPTRSSLPVLRELVSLTMHISAQVDSRLAGAGVFIVPQSAKRALAIAQGIDPDLDDDPFTEALMSAMMTAIQDRSSASALVPLVIVVPDEAVGLFNHITFSTPLDGQSKDLRDEAIRRLALGQDCPPELLLGSGSLNHWGAWLVKEDVVTTHIEPPLALICDALTTQFLWPVLIEQGVPMKKVRETVVWYDVSGLIQRPNRLNDAQSLHTAGVISDEALREAGGFAESDAPAGLDEPVQIAVDLAKKNPALIDNMPEIVAAFRDILNPVKTNVATLPDAPEKGEGVVEEEEAPAEGEAPAADGEPAGGPEGAESQGEGENLSKLPPAPKSMAAAAGVPDVPSVAIMAIPQFDSAVNSLSDKDQEPHATLIFLGPCDQFGPLNRTMISEAVRSVADSTPPFSSGMIGVEALGNDDPQATVWRLDPTSRITEVRDSLLSSPAIGPLYDRADFERFPEFRPHVTAGYGIDGDEDRIGELEKIQQVPFNKLSLWWGDEREDYPLRGRLQGGGKVVVG